jgi:hypothetical protein
MRFGEKMRKNIIKRRCKDKKYKVKMEAFWQEKNLQKFNAGIFSSCQSIK